MLSKRNALICPAHAPMKAQFCGQVFETAEAFNAAVVDERALVYLCGDIEVLVAQLTPRRKAFLAVRELSTGVRADDARYRLIGLGQLPLCVHDVGVFFPKMFDAAKDYCEAVEREHKLQALKLSNKPGESFRKGIYLTPVEAVGEELRFHLLRCSTNLDGPTENFRATDREIVDAVNAVRERFFDGSADLNHVLAQTYHNTKTDDGRERKARISQHSDKTKDMPDEGLIAFCTFYRGFEGDGFREQETKGLRRLEDSFDYVYGKHDVSVLTRLRFRLKAEAEEANPLLAKQFDVTFFPNSVFIIPLSTNRLYTHETVPSSLPVSKIPVRLGYVIRSSNTRAAHKDGQTFLEKHDGSLVPLQQPTAEGLKELSDSYYLENTTTRKIDYRDRFFFSMNSGDYLKPAP